MASKPIVIIIIIMIIGIANIYYFLFAKPFSCNTSFHSLNYIMMHTLSKQAQKGETTRSWESKASHTGALQTHLNIFLVSWLPCLGSGPHGQLSRSLEGKKTKEKGGELERCKAGFFSHRKGECLVPTCNGRSGTCKSQAAAPPSCSTLPTAHLTQSHKRHQQSLQLQARASAYKNKSCRNSEIYFIG